MKTNLNLSGKSEVRGFEERKRETAAAPTSTISLSLSLPLRLLFRIDLSRFASSFSARLTPSFPFLYLKETALAFTFPALKEQTRSVSRVKRTAKKREKTKTKAKRKKKKRWHHDRPTTMTPQPCRLLLPLLPLPRLLLQGPLPVLEDSSRGSWAKR